MKKNILTLLAIGAIAMSTLAQPWQRLGTAGFSASSAFDIDMVIDQDDTLHIICGMNGEPTKVKKFNGTDWVDVGGDVFGAGTGFTSIAQYNNTIYAAGRNTATNPAYRATVKKFNGSSWVNVGPLTLTPVQANDIDLAIDQSSGNIYLAYQESNYKGRATVMKYSSGSWTTVGSRNFTDSTARHFSMVVVNDTPYVAFKEDYGNGNGGSIPNSYWKTSVMKFNGISWEFVGQKGISPGSSDYPSLAISNDTLYLSERSQDGAGWQLFVYKFDGTNWVGVGTPSDAVTPGSYCSLQVEDGSPYVTYRDENDKATVRKFDGTSWIAMGDSSFSTGAVSYNNLLIKNGVAYVAYNDDDADNKTTVMKFECGINTGVSQFGNTLSATQGGSRATYQWYDCSNGLPINGETSRAYSPSTEGEYKVFVTLGTCSDTSICKSSACNIDTSVIYAGDSLTSNAGENATYQWIDCDNGNTEITGETSRTFKPTSSGNYAVKITEESCSTTSVCTSVTGVGVSEIEKEKISIYPNPANSYITINSKMNINKIQIIDITGKVLKSISSISNIINVADLPKGIYILKLQTNNGVVHKQFLKD